MNKVLNFLFGAVIVIAALLSTFVFGPWWLIVLFMMIVWGDDK